MERDPYAVLGVTQEAGEEEIEAAFRRLSRRVPEDGELLAAYEVLSDPKQRFLYDCFGGTRRRQHAMATPGVPPVEIAVQWYEIERGVSKPAAFEEPVRCSTCDGRGYEHGVAPGLCPRCRGAGRLNPADDDEPYHFLDMAMCLACKGTGRGPVPRCRACNGTGATVEPRALRVPIPAGALDGDEVAIRGVGRRFLLRVRAQPHDSKLVLGIAGLALVCAIALLIHLLLG